MISIGAMVASGGQAMVHIGTDEAGGMCAVKILKNELMADADHVERFRREIKVMQTRLNHPGIVPVQELKLSDGRPSYVMPWAESTLQKHIDDNPWGLREDFVVSTFKAVLDAVEFAHARSVIHRDLKPDNVLFVGGTVMVSDFGFARTLDSSLPTLTQSAVGVGTIGYMAPEVMAGGAKTADVAADIYSLGAMLYHLLSVKHPRDGFNLSAIPSQYRDLVVRATQTNPALRYSSVADLKAALELRQSGTAALQIPEERAFELVTAFQQNDASAAGSFLQLLVDERHDKQLYLNVVPTLPPEMLRAMEEISADRLALVIEAFAEALEGQHPFVVTDLYGRFLVRVWECVHSPHTRRAVIKPLLLLGYSHNRWAVQDMFINVATLASRDAECVYHLADTLREQPRAAASVKAKLLERSLPPVIIAVLNRL